MANVHEDVLKGFAEEQEQETAIMKNGIELLKEEHGQELGILLVMSVLPEAEGRAVAAVAIKRAELKKVPADRLEPNLALIKQAKWRPLGVSLLLGALPDTDRQAVAEYALLRAGGGADEDEPDEDGDDE